MEEEIKDPPTNVWIFALFELDRGGGFLFVANYCEKGGGRVHLMWRWESYAL